MIGGFETMVDTKEVKKALDSLMKEHQKKFKQTIEVVVTLKDIDLKKPDQKVDFFVTLNHGRGKKIKVCGLVGPELLEDAKKVFDHVILHNEFSKIAADKAKMKALASEYDYFVAQANIMKDVAASFGRFLGPRGKMPNPKAGCVVPPKTALEPIYERLQKTIHVQTRESPMIQLAVAKEDQDAVAVIDNIHHVYEALVHHLPLEVNNIKAVYVKLTMSPPVKVM
jgi:large subunit ribosomal protein L1